MSDEKIIYVVSEGSYSDYRIVALFEDREIAEQYVALRNGSAGTLGVSSYDEAQLEEMPVLTALPKPVTVYNHAIDVYVDGETRNEKRWTLNYFDHEVDNYSIGQLRSRRRPVVEQVRAPMHHGRGMRLHVRGWSFEAVDKVFTDRLAVLKAEPAAILRLPDRSAI